MTPSPAINLINDRKFLLPADYENKYNIHLRRERPTSNLKTAERVFTEYVLTSGNNFNTENLKYSNENSNPNFLKTTSNFYKRNNDSVGDLLSYKYGPEFREQVNIIFLI